MRAHAAHVDNQAALEQSRAERPAAASQGAAFALATGGKQAAVAGSTTGVVDSIAGRVGTAQSGAASSGIVSKGTGPSLPGDRATASSTGNLLLQLQQLSQSDPARFQQATSAIANQLQTVASGATDSNAQALAPLIRSFRAASQTGEPPSLQSLQTSSSTAGTHPSVAKYARDGAATASAFSLDALHDAVESTLS